MKRKLSIGLFVMFVILLAYSVAGRSDQRDMEPLNDLNQKQRSAVVARW